MYYAIGASVPSLHRESTDTLIIIILGECNALLASGSDPTCHAGCVKTHIKPSAHVKETSPTFRQSSQRDKTP